MSANAYKYVIVGAGLAGASAVDGIRENDRANSIMLFGDEKHLPYDRPPLSKKLWFGKMKLEKVFVHDETYYRERNVELKLGTAISGVDPIQKTVTDNSGIIYRYEKLLLATGGRPRSLPIPGGDIDGICYYRYLDDYLRIRSEAQAGKTAVIIGGGFIGSEVAAALCLNGIKVTMIFPEPYLGNRVFPESLGRVIQAAYNQRGITILCDRPVSFSRQGARFTTNTEQKASIESDMLIIGVGLNPEIRLASSARLKLGNGIAVNEFLQTSAPDIYAAGDNALFPGPLGKLARMEHWDNALNQGKQAGANMAGALRAYGYLPYFFSDLFEFGYEAVGAIDSNLKTFADWQAENQKGVVYYLDRNKIRGIMLCNVWGKIDTARALVLKGADIAEENLRGLVS